MRKIWKWRGGRKGELGNGDRVAGLGKGQKRGIYM